MNLDMIATTGFRASLQDRGVPFDVILATVPDDMAAPVLEALAVADTVDVPPMPEDARAVARMLARRQVEAALSGAKLDLVKQATAAVAANDGQVLAAHAGKQAVAELRSMAAGALLQMLPAAFDWWSARLATLQQAHAALVDEHGSLLCADELAARRADQYAVFAEAAGLRAEHDAVRSAHRAARTLTDSSDAQARYRPEAQYRHGDGRAIMSTDLSMAVTAVFAATDPMSAASAVGWLLWAPSLQQQRRAVQERLAAA